MNRARGAAGEFRFPLYMECNVQLNEIDKLLDLAHVL